ncbi:MAG TPA: isoaspartyl peptidase/L-asparaginase [Methanomicrobiales archaeon]|jgi:beta-aspartyl-peptidase (threonine type)|nr:isoaspartyl peptidase/L-asparaginase [Methanomicrobiales archaeon]
MNGCILVHGGAGQWEDAGRREKEVIASLREAVEAGLAAMQGGSAVDAVAEAVASMEGSGAFNAGKGAVLNLAGGLELDAGIMDGESLRSGAVAAVRAVPHPIRLARIVMERTGHILLVSDGAGELARVSGLVGELHPAEARLREYERGKESYLAAPAHRWIKDLGPRFAGPREGDTVGAVAEDGEGRFAAATSTGGLPFKLPGRVGDSPLVGHGYYALRGAGAASSSGVGDAIARYGLSLRAVLRMGDGTPAQDAAASSIGELTSLFGPDTAGIILLDRNGSPGIFFNTGRMAAGYGVSRSGPEARIVMREELEGFASLLGNRMRGDR